VVIDWDSVVLALVSSLGAIQGIQLLQHWRKDAPNRRGGANWLRQLNEHTGGQFDKAGAGQITGVIRDVDVHLGRPGDGGRQVISVSSSRLHPQLSIGAEGVFTQKDLQVGDADFDAAFALSGPPEVLAAFLSGDVRERLLTARRTMGLMKLESGRLTLMARCGDKELRALADGIQRALDLLAAAATPAKELPTKLAERAADRQEPIALRAVAVEQLLRRAPSSERTDAVLAQVLLEHHTALWLAAGRSLPRHPAVQDAMRRLAITASEGPLQRAEAIRSLARTGDAGLRPLLTGLLGTGGPQEVRDAAQQALAELALAAGHTGGLALAEGDAGSVALIDDRIGALSKTKA
jgi:hypothetical protein